MTSLRQHRILFFTGDIYEDLELWYPLYRLQEAGASTVVAGESLGPFSGKHGYPSTADALIDDVEAADFSGLVIPGGFMPDKLRRNPKVLELTRAFDAASKMIGMICHAGWIPISAGVMKGRRVTSTPGIRDDLTNAGAEWVDEPVVCDGHWISARRPPDLPTFGNALVNYLEKGAAPT